MPGFSLILKQMASFFCGTDIMKCGSPSTVKANHWCLYSDTQGQSSTWTFNNAKYLNLITKYKLFNRKQAVINTKPTDGKEDWENDHI